MWQVWYGHEAANYLNDNSALVVDLLFALEALAETAGWPHTGDYQQADDLVIWETLSHLVVYQRREDIQVIQVALIKPN